MSRRRTRFVESRRAPRPRVLLVDDHRDILDRISAMLGQDFEVAGFATDGHSALDAARQLAPDLIVLDINMPRMDGFQTMRALTEAGSRAPVVFLSMLDEEETVAEAFRCGARGYVLKSDVVRDLGTALDQVRHGRLFAPSLTSLFRLADGPGPDHAMQVYGDLSSLLDGLAALFDMALQRGDAACVIASEEIRQGLGERLRDRGWDVDGPSGHKRYMAVDPADCLKRFMRNGLPDPDLIASVTAELEQYRRAVTAGGTGRLTCFGTMSACLTVDGNPDAVVPLESLWNEVTRDFPFFTVCGYDSTCFHEDPELWSSACAQHWAVSHASDA